MAKKVLFVVYIVILLCLGMATIIEPRKGTSFVADYIYGSWWMCVLWGLLAALGIFYILKQKAKRLSLISLHLSFAIILLGAFVTHLTARSGQLHLRTGEWTDSYQAMDDEGEVQAVALPYSIRLDSFELKTHEGTFTPADYISNITLISDGDTSHAQVAMNQICSHSGIRLYQSDYDPDGEGSTLHVSSDPWGIPITYTGYGLLFISLIWMLFDRRGTFRSLLRHPLMKKGVLCLVLFIGTSVFSSLHAAKVLPEDVARDFCKLNVLYNGRICPLQTYAIDFTKKMTGSRSYKGYSAEQVFTGFIFWPNEWRKEKLIRVKSSEVRDKLHLPEYISYSMLFREGEGYILSPFLHRGGDGQADKFHKGVYQLDEKCGIINDVMSSESLLLFPYTQGGKTVWYSPTSDLPKSIPVATVQDFIRYKLFSMKTDAATGDLKNFKENVLKINKFQRKFGGDSIPSDLQLKAEYLYNGVPFATILFMVNLGMGVLCLFYAIYRLTRHREKDQSIHRYIQGIEVGMMVLSFLALTLCLGLRWIIRGSIPMSNGYETMIVMAWMVQLVSIMICKRFQIILSFGFLLSGLFLLVSHISQMDPQITPMMPVLSSPLLTIHVSIIMMAYALLAFTFICGLTALLLRLFRGKGGTGIEEQLTSLQLLSRLFLYPSLVALGFGIFIGAIWANVSWGTYWSWDPKETWALITMMVYAIAVHTNTIPAMRKPLVYHAFMTLAFLTILMTYFGVNYLLGGMHSYA